MTEASFDATAPRQPHSSGPVVACLIRFAQSWKTVTIGSVESTHFGEVSFCGLSLAPGGKFVPQKHHTYVVSVKCKVTCKLISHRSTGIGMWVNEFAYIVKVSLHVNERECFFKEDNEHARGNAVIVVPVFMHICLLCKDKR